MVTKKKITKDLVTHGNSKVAFLWNCHSFEQENLNKEGWYL